MKYVYRLCCKTACITGILLVSMALINVSIAQTDPNYSNANYTPMNMGKVIPNDNYPANSINPREKTRFVYEGNNSMTRLPEPVSMYDLYLTATANDGIIIRWSTTWEPDNLKLYEIEYSTDNIHFQQAGVVPAGNYLNGRIYEFRHYPINVRDRMFYRVRVTDANGRFDYTQTLAQTANGSTQNYIFPTIINTGTVSLYLNDSFKSLQIVSMDGRVLQNKMLNGNTGRVDVSLNTTLQGICFVRVLGQNRQRDIVQKIFIQ
jgi:hypothetical protein